jgi:hypothetical protein
VGLAPIWGGWTSRGGHTGRHGQGKAAYTERVEPAGVGITALTTDAQ